MKFNRSWSRTKWDLKKSKFENPDIRITPYWFPRFHVNVLLEDAMLCFCSIFKAFPHVRTVWELELRGPSSKLWDELVSSLENRLEVSDNKLFIGFDFVITRSSSSDGNLSIGVSKIVKLKMLNRRVRFFHSSRMKFPFWLRFFCDIKIVDLDLDNKLTLSNIYFNETLWILVTCLKVGLRLSMIILITTSLSPKMKSMTSKKERFVSVITFSTSDN